LQTPKLQLVRRFDLKVPTRQPNAGIDVRCLAEATGGQYIQTSNQEELVEAFQKTLGCPMMSRLVHHPSP
jgi:hypothetical protein